MEKPHPLKVIGIMIILFGLPLISWLFMKSGADFRMNVINELGQFGKIQNFDLLKSNGERFTQNDVSKKVLMVSFLPENFTVKSEKAQQLKWIQEQFQERLLKRSDFMVLSPIIVDSLSQLTKVKNGLDIEGGKFRRWEIVGGGKEILKDLGENGFYLPLKDGETVFDNPYLAIVDVDGEVRNFYNIFEKEEIAKMIMHLSLLLPPQDDRKVEIKTELEQ